MPSLRLEHHDHARLLPRYRERARLEAQQREALRAVLAEMTVEEIRAEAEKRRTPPTPAGDGRRLRGIPAIGRDWMGGAIPGSRPTDALRRL